MFDPIFSGELVRLTPPHADDQEQFALWTHDDDYMRLLDDDPVRPQSSSSFASFSEATKNDDFYFHLRTLKEGQLIGFVALFNLKWRNQTAELAIGIGAPEFRARGYGRDALSIILNYAFSELCLHRVSLTVMSYNARAIKAYESVGFQQEGIHRQAIRRGDQRHDLILYGILREEWQRLRAPSG